VMGFINMCKKHFRSATAPRSQEEELQRRKVGTAWHSTALPVSCRSARHQCSVPAPQQHGTHWFGLLHTPAIKHCVLHAGHRLDVRDLNSSVEWRKRPICVLVMSCVVLPAAVLLRRSKQAWVRRLLACQMT
jgi:hypothetical protein